jgi:hypothetical protein
VLSEGDKPAIRVDVGPVFVQVFPLRPGQALLEREFRGLKSETCFVVAASSEMGFSDLSNCRALRARYGAPLPERSPQGTTSPHALSPYAEVRTDQMIESATLSPDVKDKFEANDRLQISTEGVSLPLGEPATLAVHLTGPEVLQTAVYQKVLQSYALEQPAPHEDYETDVRGKFGTIQTAPDGSAYMKLIARRLRKAEFRIEVLFADGGVATRTFEVPVRLSEHSPVQLTNAVDGSRTNLQIPATTLRLSLAAPDNVGRLYPVVRYRQDQGPFLLAPGDVKFKVRQADKPVIRLDESTGEVTALRPGDALIEASFAGARSETCVEVMADLAKDDLFSCQELRAQLWLENLFRGRN